MFFSLILTHWKLLQWTLQKKSGSIRDYLVHKSGIENPPDLTISIPVDIRGINESDSENAGVNYVLLTSPLPTNTEGSVLLNYVFVKIYIYDFNTHTHSSYIWDFRCSTYSV